MGRRPGQLLVAEVKTTSPFGWESDESLEELFAIADKHGDRIAIHTDERWGGSFELLSTVTGERPGNRPKTNKIIWAKGIHETDEHIAEAVERGAGFVTVVGRIPEVHIEQCLLEPDSLDQLKDWRDQRAISRGSRIIWNDRDLNTGERKLDSFEDARQLWPGWLCQASFIRTADDLRPDAQAALIGTHLPEFVETLA